MEIREIREMSGNMKKGLNCQGKSREFEKKKEESQGKVREF